MLDFVQSLNLLEVIHYLSDNPHIIGIFTFIVVFLEAMAVVGAIIPGVIVMPAIGFLIGSSVVPAGSTLLCAVTGAITGDCLSYLIGAYFKDRIHRVWPFTRWPNLLTHSENFFHNHGGKSVIIGRFAGPTRAMIPMIAGMFKMPALRFFLTSIPSATVWAVAYITPGILLGALSLELPPKVAAEFALWGFIGLIALWIIVWLIQHFFRQIWRFIDGCIVRSWKYLQTHKESSRFTKLLSDPKEPDNHHQLTLLVIAFFLFMIFLWIFYQVLTTGWMIDLSQAVYYLLRSLRIFCLQTILMVITFLGDINMIMVAFGLIFLWLFRSKDLYVAAHFLGVMLVIGAMLVGLKHFMFYHRPGDILFEIHRSSFPSAHVAFSLCFYGFLGVIIARELKAFKKYLVYTLVGMLVAIVAFSRIYLGAHWFSDITASIFLGGSVLLVGTVFYRRRHIIHFKIKRFIAVVLSVIFAVWAGYSMIEYKKKIHQYDLIWPEQTVTFESLTTADILDDLPLYRLNRLGKPIEAFNIIYVGNLDKIKKTLSKGGWEPQPIVLDFQTMVQGFSKTTVANHLSIFSQLYHNKKMAFLFAKRTQQEDVVLLLRLWSSDAEIEDSKLPLWIGSVDYNHSKPSIFSLKRFKVKPHFIGATDVLAKELKKGFHLWKKEIPISDQPVEMRCLKWDGKLLVIKSN